MDGEGNVDKSWDVGPKQHKGPVLGEHSCFLTDTSCGLGVLQEALPEQGRLSSAGCADGDEWTFHFAHRPVPGTATPGAMMG